MIVGHILFNCFLLFLLMLKMMVSLAYLTLFERKVLSYMQNRKGPNKVGMLGVFQPFSDAVKLLLKEFFIIYSISFYYYLLMPMLMILLSFMMWFIYPYYINWISMDMGLMLLLCLLGMNIYPVMLMGWSSSSNYSMLGSIRSIAQAISYEVSLFLIFFILVIMIEDFNMIIFIKFQFMISFIIFMCPIYLIFFFSMLIELNRTPFDLIEGESELVSGFNTEYYGSLFTMIFMSEYLMIVFISFLITLMFWGFNLMSLMFNMFMLIHMFIIIWIRGVLPRMRYDDLMNLCWKKILTLGLLFILYYLGVKEFIIINML